MYKQLAGIAIFLFLAGTVNKLTAQNNEARYDSLSLKLSEVVVSANRYGSVSIKTPEAIRILDENTIAKTQLRTAPEALALTPGVFIQKTNHGGGSPFIRGLTGNQTLLLIDGIRLSNAVVRYGPNQYFNTIDIFSTGKMEVMRGSGSVQYGSDAIGGTIQSFSRDLDFSAEKKLKGSALTRLATHGMEKTIHGDLVASCRKAAIRGGVTYRDFGDIVGGDTTGRQSPTGYRELDFDIKGKISLSKSSVITMVFQNVHQMDVPVYHKLILENYEMNRMNPQDRQLSYLRLDQKINMGILKSARITSSYQQSSETRESRKNGSDVLRTEKDRVRSLGFSAEAYAANSSGWSSNTGFEIYNDFVRSSREDANGYDKILISNRGLYPDKSEMTGIAFFSMHTMALGNWSISGGARFNSYINRVAEENTGSTVLKPSALVGSVGILRKITPNSTLFLSACNGFRAPNIDDLGTLGIVDFRYETPNYNLQPEHSFQYQAGYKLNGRKLQAELYVYRNELYNLIVRNRVAGESIEGYPVYRKENVERAYIQGVESAVSFQVNKDLSLSGDLTWTFGQNITRNEPVRRIPPLFGRFVAEYGRSSWSANLEWIAAGKQDRLAAGDRDDNRIPAGGTPGWNVFNINGKYTSDRYSVNLGIMNILNEDYRYHGSGINGYGRSAILTLMIEI